MVVFDHLSLANFGHGADKHTINHKCGGAGTLLPCTSLVVRSHLIIHDGT